MIDSFLKHLDMADRIIIYGAGAVAGIVSQVIMKYGYGSKICCFAVSDVVGQPDSRSGLPVCGIDRAVKEYESSLIIIAVQNSTQKYLVNRLDELGYKDYLVIDDVSFIDSLYEQLWVKPILNNKILFQNYKGSGYGCNPKYITEELIHRCEDLDVDIVWAVNDIESHVFPKEIRTVKIGTYEYYEELATAHIWIDNARKEADVRKRDGQYYIQTWHGAAPFKKVERDLETKVSQSLIRSSIKDSEMADLFISGSRFYTDLYRTSFWYDGEIMESGLPRQDVFWNSDGVRSKIIKHFKTDENSFLVLYAPTFRDDYDETGYLTDFSDIRRAVEKRYGRECVFLVGRHPNNKDIVYRFDDADYIDVGAYDDFEEILVAADMLITDYSGCVYDYSFTGKPAFLYQPDLSKIKLQRDFYVDILDMPYPSARTMDELVDAIMTFDDTLYKRKLEAFMSRFGNYDDGCASERVCERICQILKNGADGYA